MYVEADDRMVVLIRSQVMWLVGQKSQTTVRKITRTVNMLELNHSCLVWVGIHNMKTLK